MEDQVAVGLFILDGSVRVRTPDGLVRLDELAPQTDMSGYYTKQEVNQRRASIDTQLLFKQQCFTFLHASNRTLEPNV